MWYGIHNDQYPSVHICVCNISYKQLIHEFEIMKSIVFFVTLSGLYQVIRVFQEKFQKCFPLLFEASALKSELFLVPKLRCRLKIFVALMHRFRFWFFFFFSNIQSSVSIFKVLKSCSEFQLDLSAISNKVWLGYNIVYYNI